METEDIPLVTTGLPGCPYQITSYNGPALSDMNLAFGLHLHHPRFLEFIGAPESAWLLYHSPSFWVDRLGEERAMAAERHWPYVVKSSDSFAVCYATANNVVGDDVHRHRTWCSLPKRSHTTAAMAPWAAKYMYMAAIGLWHPQTGPGDPGPVPASSCNTCMNCQYCFPGGWLPPE